MKNYIAVKKIIPILLSVLMLFNTLSVYATDIKCSDYIGNNVNANNYEIYAKPINSYLYKTGDKYIRFQADNLSSKYSVEYYNNSFKLIKNFTVETELNIFGGFYFDGNNYYILSGQKNPNEKPDVEIFRITKYDKDFKKIKSIGLYDCNTVSPFEAGCARFVKSGKYLIIRTSHKMYKSNDGKNHQANATFQIDTDNMSFTVSQTSVENSSYGYVSHSFNQFIQVENGKLLAVDHGDAYPRSIVMFMYHSPLNSGDFLNSSCEMKEIYSFLGEKGDNFTGASVGGFEYSDSSYIVAYNSVSEDDKNDSSRNIYVGVVDKATKNVKIKTVASDIDGSNFSTPHLVKISDNDFMIMWSKDNNISYAKLDGKGNINGKIRMVNNANLSDCQPIVSDGKIVWYSFEKAKCTFYTINIDNIDDFNYTTVDNGHNFEVKKAPSVLGGSCTVVCTKCSITKEIEKTETDISVVWSKDENGKFNSIQNDNTVDINQKLFYKISNSQVNINVSDPQSITHNNNSFVFKKSGSYIITFTYKYNTSVKKAFTINVSHINKNCDEKCDICGEKVKINHLYDNDCDGECNNCGYKREVKNNITHTFSQNISSGVTIQVNSDTENYSSKLTSGNVSNINSNNNSVGLSSDNYFENSDASNANNNSLNSLFESGKTNSSSSDYENNYLFTNKKITVIFVAVISIIVLSLLAFLVWYFFFKKNSKNP